MNENPIAPKRSAFFLIAAALMTLVVFLGFLPSFYLRPFFRDQPLPFHVIAHGVIMTAWLLLFLTQTMLVARRRSDLHRRLGWVGAWLAFIVVVTGVHTTLLLPARLAETGATLPFPLDLLVIGNLLGFVLFAGFVTVAIRWRRDTQLHKRLLFWAGVVTMGPALTAVRSLGEMLAPFFPSTLPPEQAVIWIAWTALLTHDWLSRRAFHPASVVGGFLILFVQFPVLDYVVAIPAVGEWVQSLR
jgi:hypothetical protein